MTGLLIALGLGGLLGGLVRDVAHDHDYKRQVAQAGSPHLVGCKTIEQRICKKAIFTELPLTQEEKDYLLEKASRTELSKLVYELYWQQTGKSLGNEAGNPTPKDVHSNWFGHLYGRKK